MALRVEIPGRGVLALEHLLLDQNGTLTDRGQLIDGVAERLARVGRTLQVFMLTADTFGTLDGLVSELGIDGQRVSSREQKRAFMASLGTERCVAIGNGSNDVPMLRDAALGVAIIGPEGASTAAVAAADIVCRSVLEALDLLSDERVLIATLRR